MMPCCELVNEKYLDTKSTVDEKALHKILKRRKKERPMVLCKCSCHIKGSNVIH
jgi:hypothetical protein